MHPQKAAVDAAPPGAAGCPPRKRAKTRRIPRLSTAFARDINGLIHSFLSCCGAISLRGAPGLAKLNLPVGIVRDRTARKGPSGPARRETGSRPRPSVIGPSQRFMEWRRGLGQPLSVAFGPGPEQTMGTVPLGVREPWEAKGRKAGGGPNGEFLGTGRSAQGVRFSVEIFGSMPGCTDRVCAPDAFLFSPISRLTCPERNGARCLGQPAPPSVDATASLAPVRASLPAAETRINQMLGHLRKAVAGGGFATTFRDAVAKRRDRPPPTQPRLFRRRVYHAFRLCRSGRDHRIRPPERIAGMSRKARTAASNSRGFWACSQCPAPGTLANRALGNSALMRPRCSVRT